MSESNCGHPPQTSRTLAALWHGRTGDLKVVDAQITFLVDYHGRATELILHQGGQGSTREAN